VPDATAAPSAEVGGGPLSLLTKAYALRSGEVEVVAGRDAQQVMAFRPDGSVAARFWLDVATGLLLRRELLDPKGSVTHSSIFVSVRPGEAGDVEPDGEVTQPWSTEIGVTQLQDMGAGWLCPQQIGSLTLYDVRRTTTTDPVVHFAYSDGLVSVSVFEERGHLSVGSLKGYTRTSVAGRQVSARMGTAEELTWQSGPMVYTVVTDAPPETVAAVVAALPTHKAAPRSTWTRVHSGLNRMGSWVDPRG
jgi:sigma-E factor negative regulatory protein RseB